MVIKMTKKCTAMAANAFENAMDVVDKEQKRLENVVLFPHHFDAPFATLGNLAQNAVLEKLL